MKKQALVIIDIQNDITKNYKEIIGNINKAIAWAVGSNIHVIYIKHNNLSAGTRTFKPGTPVLSWSPTWILYLVISLQNQRETH